MLRYEITTIDETPEPSMFEMLVAVNAYTSNGECVDQPLHVKQYRGEDVIYFAIDGYDFTIDLVTLEINPS